MSSIRPRQDHENTAQEDHETARPPGKKENNGKRRKGRLPWTAGTPDNNEKDETKVRKARQGRKGQCTGR